jgi:coenzyme F420-reducing hydrogenase delta subunit
LLAKGRVGYTREFLGESGLEEERIRMVNVSAAMARPLVDHMNDLIETVRKLGPNPIAARSETKKEEIEV